VRYYQFHIGDYAADTRYLTLLEDLAYRRMLDWYYLHECVLPESVEAVAKAIGMRDHLQEVSEVLQQFFVHQEGRGWLHTRIEEEIAACQVKLEAASRAGKTSAERRRNDRSTTVEHPLNDRSTTVQPPITHYPLPIPPNPPLGGGATLNGGGASAGQTDAPGDESLCGVLLGTRYRAGLKGLKRSLEVRKRAGELEAEGLEPHHVLALSELASAKSSDDPGALLAHWLDGGKWREVLDEQASKAKTQAAKRRGKAAQADDLLDGIYGETNLPKHINEVRA
jgi:uncharacterized protein YdaU (DUF1376 family)